MAATAAMGARDLPALPELTVSPAQRARAESLVLLDRQARKDLQEILVLTAHLACQERRVIAESRDLPDHVESMARLAVMDGTRRAARSRHIALNYSETRGQVS